MVILARMRILSILAVCLFLAGCGLFTAAPELVPERERSQASPQGREVALYAMSLIDTGYRFGGKNPEAGLDCSGMVSYVFRQAAGMKLVGSAADIARKGRPVGRQNLYPGDLVFFNTRNAPFSHVGIYIGDGRFIHAPSSRGRVRIDRMSASYYAERFFAARAYFD